jgi:hypothetical protein
MLINGTQHRKLRVQGTPASPPKPTPCTLPSNTWTMLTWQVTGTDANGLLLPMQAQETCTSYILNYFRLAWFWGYCRRGRLLQGLSTHQGCKANLGAPSVRAWGPAVAHGNSMASRSGPRNAQKAFAPERCSAAPCSPSLNVFKLNNS